MRPALRVAFEVPVTRICKCEEVRDVGIGQWPPNCLSCPERLCVSKSCDHSDASEDKAYIFCLHLRLLLNEEDLRQHGVSPACL